MTDAGDDVGMTINHLPVIGDDGTVTIPVTIGSAVKVATLTPDKVEAFVESLQRGIIERGRLFASLGLVPIHIVEEARSGRHGHDGPVEVGVALQGAGWVELRCSNEVLHQLHVTVTRVAKERGLLFD